MGTRRLTRRRCRLAPKVLRLSDTVRPQSVVVWPVTVPVLRSRQAMLSTTAASPPRPMLALVRRLRMLASPASMRRTPRRTSSVRSRSSRASRSPVRVRPSPVLLVRLVVSEEAPVARHRPVGVRPRRPVARRRPRVAARLLREARLLLVAASLRRPAGARLPPRRRRHPVVAAVVARSRRLVVPTAAVVAEVAARLRPGRTLRPRSRLLPSRHRRPRLRSLRLLGPRLRSPRRLRSRRASRPRLVVATPEQPVTVCARPRTPSVVRLMPSVVGDGREGRRADFPPEPRRSLR